MLALAGALTLLFEAAIQICRIHDRRAARRSATEAWDLDSPSEIDTTPSRIDGPADVGGPSEIAGPSDIGGQAPAGPQTAVIGRTGKRPPSAGPSPSGPPAATDWDDIT